MRFYSECWFCACLNFLPPSQSLTLLKIVLMSEITSSSEQLYFSASTSENFLKINRKRRNNHLLNKNRRNTIDLLTDNACAHLIVSKNLFCSYFFYSCELTAYILREIFFKNIINRLAHDFFIKR